MTAELKKKLAQWCAPAAGDGTYFRPFLCQEDLDKIDPSKVKIFLAGVNPATVFTVNDFRDAAEYVKVLSDYNAFMKIYKERRIKSGKPALSRTRTGIERFRDEVLKNEHTVVFETDINAYPAPSQEDLAELRKTNPSVFDRGRQVFIELFNFIKPQILVLYGEEAVKSFLEGAEKNGLLKEGAPKYNGIEDLEHRGEPAFTVAFAGGESCAVFACRHLMYYGKEGDSYGGFKETVLKHIKNYCKC
jgi:hypothetical protein